MTHILQFTGASDGNGNLPPASARMWRDDNSILAALGDKWVTDPNVNFARMAGAKYAFNQLPTGYSVWHRLRRETGNGPRTDSYIFGHPTNIRFDSIVGFWEHFKHLQLHGTHVGCGCRLCIRTVRTTRGPNLNGPWNNGLANMPQRANPVQPQGPVHQVVAPQPANPVQQQGPALYGQQPGIPQPANQGQNQAPAPQVQPFGNIIRAAPKWNFTNEVIELGEMVDQRNSTPIGDWVEKEGREAAVEALFYLSIGRYAWIFAEDVTRDRVGDLLQAQIDSENLEQESKDYFQNLHNLLMQMPSAPIGNVLAHLAPDAGLEFWQHVRDELIQAAVDLIFIEDPQAVPPVPDIVATARWMLDADVAEGYDDYKLDFICLIKFINPDATFDQVPWLDHQLPFMLANGMERFSPPQRWLQ